MISGAFAYKPQLILTSTLAVQDLVLFFADEKRVGPLINSLQVNMERMVDWCGCTLSVK